MIIKLTNLEAGALEFYLRLTEGYRDKELEKWKLAAKELDNNGYPVHFNAEDNVELWIRLVDVMQSITQKIRSSNQ